MFSGKILLHIAALLLLLINTNWLIAESVDELINSSTFTYVVRDIEHLNFDCVEDTLVVQIIDNKYLLPKFIFWGQDTTHCLNESIYSHSLIVQKSEIIYPEWEEFKSSTFLRYANLNDTIMDIYIQFTGKIHDTDTTTIDTSQHVILFGQYNIDIMDTINLSSLYQDQDIPIYTRMLRYSMGLDEPAIRDESNNISYRVTQIDLNVQQDTSAQYYDKDPLKIVPEISDNIQIYPNPANDLITIESSIFLNGTFIIEVQTIDGATQIRKEVDLNQPIFKMPVVDLATGSYMILIYYMDKIIKSKRITIIH